MSFFGFGRRRPVLAVVRCTMYDVAEAACSGRRPDRRRAAKLLIGQILIVLAVMTLGLWAATQWAAATLAYRPRPGRALVVIRRLPVS